MSASFEWAMVVLILGLAIIYTVQRAIRSMDKWERWERDKWVHEHAQLYRMPPEWKDERVDA